MQTNTNLMLDFASTSVLSLWHILLWFIDYSALKEAYDANKVRDISL